MAHRPKLALDPHAVCYSEVTDLHRR